MFYWYIEKWNTIPSTIGRIKYNIAICIDVRVIAIQICHKNFLGWQTVCAQNHFSHLMILIELICNTYITLL